MNLRLRRLNLDTSWEVHWDDMRVVIDPWLIGSEVDYFKWFNEQWHLTDPVPPSEISKPDLILISQSYSDHCHEKTIEQFDKRVPIIASPKAYKRLKKSFSTSRIIKLPLLVKEGLIEMNGLRIASLDPGRIIDPVYYAHIIVKGNEAIFYSSHGFNLSSAQLEVLSNFKIKTLITSFSKIKLPSLLGGAVNPGIENVKQLVSQLQPEVLFNSHDEQKTHKGIVMKMAKTFYPDYDSLRFSDCDYMVVDDYEYRKVK